MFNKKNYNNIEMLLYILLNIFLIGGIFVLIFIPGFFIKFIHSKNIIRYIIFAEIECFMELLIIYELKNIMNRIIEAKIFIMKNIRSFSRIGIYTFILGIFYMMGDIINKNFHIIYAFNKDGSLKLDIFVFIILGCTFLVISQVLKIATNIKNENDFTI